MTNSPANENSKRSLISLLVMFVILFPCLSYAIIGDAPLIPILSSIFLIISLMIKAPVTTTKRTVIYSLTISAIITVILNETYPVDGDRFFIPMPTEILFPFVISLAICASFFIQSSLTLTIILALSSFSMMLHGSCVSNPANTRLIIESNLWTNRYWVFGFFLSLQMIVFIPLIYYAQDRRYSIFLAKKETHKLRLAIYTCSITALIVGIIISCLLVQKVESAMEPFFNRLFKSYIYTFRSRVVFSNEVDLYRKTTPQVQQNAKRIILRAKSKVAPGYLRGRTYDIYNNGKWTVSNNTFSNLPLVNENDNQLNVNLFSRNVRKFQNTDIQHSKIDIIPSRFFRSDVILAKGSSHTVEIIADAVENNRDGTMKPKSWDRNGAYSLLNVDKVNNEAYNFFESTDQNLYTAISNRNLNDKLKKISATIIDDINMEPLQKIRTVEKYLLTNFEYDLNTLRNRKKSPVLQFLEDNKAGHCELFATSAALLLRAQGIPTRYVTGFICSEPHPNPDFWISRLGDCHAWLEAWDANKQQWILVEPTPPSGIPAGNIRSNFISKFMEHIIVYWKEGYAQIKRGYFARAVLTYISGVGNFLSWLFWKGPWYIGWCIIAVSLMLLYRYLNIKYKKASYHKQPMIIECHNILDMIEKYLRKFNIRRSDTMSIRDLMLILKNTGVPKTAEVCRLLEEYESIRYRPAAPDRKVLRKLSQHVSEELIL